MCTKFQVCIVFRFARRRDTHKYTHIQVNLGKGRQKPWKFLIWRHLQKLFLYFHHVCMPGLEYPFCTGLLRLIGTIVFIVYFVKG